MSFAQAVEDRSALTENGAITRASSADAIVDLFYALGGMRGKDIMPLFTAAYAQDKELTMRVVLHGRDAREGVGERKIFRDILLWLANRDEDMLFRVLPRVPVMGRWDDLLIFKPGSLAEKAAFTLIKLGLEDEFHAGLVSKWMPRDEKKSRRIRKFLGMNGHEFRKKVLSLSNTVEQKMCEKDWDGIDFSKVPSMAFSRYRKAFMRNAPERFEKFVAKAAKGEVKVNAGAVTPVDVLGDLVKSVCRSHGAKLTNTDIDAMVAQWDNLPNYMENGSILPLVDVSGSMMADIPKSRFTCMDAAVSLGLYCADKNKGAFNGLFLTFSSVPELVKLSGRIDDKVKQMVKSKWNMGTNIDAAIEKILRVAVEGKVAPEDMPRTLVIFSDMQFNPSWGGSAHQTMERAFAEHGYEVPNVVFWNLRHAGNVPVRHDKNGTALVSGYSANMVKSILGGDDFTPFGIMMKAVMNERYNLA